jgi:hypothetical protein
MEHDMQDRDPLGALVDAINAAFDGSGFTAESDFAGELVFITPARELADLDELPEQQRAAVKGAHARLIETNPMFALIEQWEGSRSHIAWTEGWALEGDESGLRVVPVIEPGDLDPMVPARVPRLTLAQAQAAAATGTGRHHEAARALLRRFPAPSGAAAAPSPAAATGARA